MMHAKDEAAVAGVDGSNSGVKCETVTSQCRSRRWLMEWSRKWLVGSHSTHDGP